MGYSQALHFAPHSMMSHVAKLFLDCLMPFLVLRGIQMVVGILKGHRLDKVALKGISEIELFNFHLFFCIENEIRQGINRKRGEVKISDFFVGYDFLDLVFFFIPSRSIILLDRSVILISVAMASNVICCVRIIRSRKFLHGIDGSCVCRRGNLFVVIVIIVISIVVIIVIVMCIVVVGIYFIVIIVVCFIVIVVIWFVISVDVVGSSSDFGIVVVIFFLFLRWRVVAHFVKLDDVGCDPTNIAHRPYAFGFQVEHFESTAGMIFGISDEHAMSATVVQLAAQRSGIVHDTNFSKNM